MSWIKGYKELSTSNPTQARLLDEQATASRATFEAWGEIDGKHHPEHPTDAMQWRLQLWQRHNFGLQPDVNQILGMIEEVGETFAATDWIEILDGLADTCVYAGQVLIGNRMALRPVMDLAVIHTDRWYGSPVGPCREAIIGLLAHVALKHEQKIRDLADVNTYRIALVDTMSQVIGAVYLHAILAHAAASHPVGPPFEVPDLFGNYIKVGEEVLKRDWKRNASTG